MKYLPLNTVHSAIEPCSALRSLHSRHLCVNSTIYLFSHCKNISRRNSVPLLRHVNSSHSPQNPIKAFSVEEDHLFWMLWKQLSLHISRMQCLQVPSWYRGWWSLSRMLSAPPFAQTWKCLQGQTASYYSTVKCFTSYCHLILTIT